MLRQEGLYEDAAAVATKRVVVWQLEQAMEARGLSKAQLARQMGTSRAALHRLLDPENDSVTLRTLARAASVLNANLQVTFSSE
jgi:DNA-binding Xre family transcriptional regulator